MLVIFQALLALFSLMTYVERRVLAFMQFRLGPNRTGPCGILQPVADGIKLFFKEEVIPEGANKWLFVAAPAVAIVTAFLSIAVVPWGGTLPSPSSTGGLAGAAPPTGCRAATILLQIADLDVGILFLFAVSSLGVYAIVMAGWAANNKYTLIGGLRSSAQMFSYELALGLSWVGAHPAGGLLPDPRHRGRPGPAGASWHWNFAARSSPRFLVYLVAATAEVNRTPFDLPEAETELVAGFHTEYSSMRFALLQMAEYVNMITVSAVGANLFFGGWLSPIPGLPDSPLWFVAQAARGAVLLHLAARHAAPLALRPAHGLRLEGAGAHGHPGHPGHRGARWPSAADDAPWTPSSSMCSRPWPWPRPLVVVAQRNPIYSAFALIVTLCSLSAIFGLLGSPFIAVLQVVVYAGAIMVLFLFVLMLLNVKPEDGRRGGADAPWRWPWPWAPCSWPQVAAVLAARRVRGRGRASTPPRGGGPRALLRPRYLYVFEATSILILAALVGAMAAGQRDLRPSRPHRDLVQHALLLSLRPVRDRARWASSCAATSSPCSCAWS